MKRLFVAIIALASMTVFMVQAAAAPKPGDTTPPKVVSTNPLNAAPSVPVRSTMSVTYSEALSASSIVYTFVKGSGKSATTVPATMTYNAQVWSVSLTPTTPLAFSSAYTITMQAQDLAGNLSTKLTLNFTTEAAPPPPNAAPVAALSVSPASGPAPLAVKADASASTDDHAVVSYSFDFGDGTVVGPQSSAVANHTYSAQGPYTVTVTATDAAGLSSSATAAVSASAPLPPPNQAPVAALSVSPTTGEVPVVVTADASASTDDHGVVSYAFDFGDGTVVEPQAGATATHTYSVKGTYTVTATATDAAGLSSSTTATVVAASANQAPVAALTVSPSTGQVPVLVTADASGSTDDHGVVSYSFDFGDGTVVGPQASATATHTYSAKGTYTVTVTATDAAGLTSSATASVAASEPPPPPNQAPVAALTLSPPTGEVPVVVTADASGSTDDHGVVSYSFDFGDGTVVGPQAGATATHTYSVKGTFIVTATATDAAGLTSSATATVTAAPANQAPVAAVSLSAASGLVPFAVTADASASTDDHAVTSYSFDFGDGTNVGPQSGATATHSYRAKGSYTVTATVTDAAGLTSSATATVTASDPPPPDAAPVAQLSVTPSTGTVPVATTADASQSTDTDVTPISKYTFDFGDGTVVGPQSSPTAAHSYPTKGLYTITLTVTDSGGLTGTSTATVTANDPKYRPLNNDCSGGNVEFTFDDGTSSNTPALLEALAGLGIKATFFTNGANIDSSAANQQAARDEVAQGHSVQNHTYDHASFTGASTPGTGHLTDTQIINELQASSASVTQLGLPKPTLYRPPYGDIDAYTDNLIRGLGYRIVMPWGVASYTGPRIVDTRDWTGISSAEIASNAINGSTDQNGFHPGMNANAIISMHDGEGTSAPNSVGSLQAIVDYMNTKHFCATTVIPQDATGGVVPLPAPAQPAAAQNLVQNPSLETNAGGNSAPTCFQQGGAGAAGNTASWAITSDAHTGVNAERVTVTGWTSGDRKLVLDQRGFAANCIPTLSPGQSVRTWVWYKGSWSGYGASTDATKVSIAVYYRTGNAASPTWNYWMASPLVPPTSNWSLASVATPPLPAGATGVSFGLAIQGNGTVTTDDYSMAVTG